MKPKYFAEFYRKGSDGSFVPGVGDRSVILLDGRESLYNQKFMAILECRKRGFDAYRIAHGTFTTPTYLTPLVTTDGVTVNG